MAEKDDYLPEMLKELGFVTEGAISLARIAAKAESAGVVDTLLKTKNLTPAQVTMAKAAHFGAEVVDLGSIEIRPEIIALIPKHLVEKFRVVPVEHSPGRITVAISDPSDLDTIDSFSHLLRSEISIKVASEEDLAATMKKYYGINTVPESIEGAAEVVDIDQVIAMLEELKGVSPDRSEVLRHEIQRQLNIIFIEMEAAVTVG